MTSFPSGSVLLCPVASRAASSFQSLFFSSGEGIPYGIPSAELKGKDWNELAAALATGQRRTLPDGKEVTAIGGRWYYSDPGDSSSFLKEHGATARAGPKAPSPPRAVVPSVDTATLLAKLEERFAKGQISEGSYLQLKRKYEAMLEETPKKDDWVEER